MNALEASLNIDEIARVYEKKHGHPPLIIGREYVYLDEWFELVEASQDHIEVRIRNRMGTCTRVEPNQLTWKPQRPPRWSNDKAVPVW